MANYTSQFTKPYANGWKDLPDETTPITADALNEVTDTIDAIDSFLNGTEQNAQENVIEEIKVNGVAQTVANKSVNLVIGGGGASDYPDLTNKPLINGVELVGNKSSKQLKIVDELTYAEYNALTDAQKNDGQMRIVKNYPLAPIPMVASSSGGGINYSTDEQDTGLTWVDGRSVYQKTYVGTLSGTTALIEALGNREIIDTEAFFMSAGGLGLSLGQIPNNGDWGTAIHIDGSSNIVLYVGGGMENGTYKLTLKYVKGV